MGGLVGFAFLVLALIHVNAKDVFRYVDDESGQSHYMTGEPGKSVEGGWTFTNADGSFELVYKADENGFQPKAEHIPEPVVDTNEVVEAKANFYSLYKEHEAKVVEALEGAKEAVMEAVVDVRRKRETEETEAVEENMEAKKSENKLVYANSHIFGQPLKYNFHPYLGFVPNYAEAKEEMSESDMKEMEYKFVPYFGFVPANDKETVEEGMEKSDDGVRYKFDPLYGFVQVKKVDADQEEEHMEPMAEQEYKYVPYIGFVPLTPEDKTSENADDMVSYKFNPFYGFVQAKEEGEAMNEASATEEPKYKFVPYYGFVPVHDKEMEKDDSTEETDMKADDENKLHMQYVFHPYHGYLPTLVKKPEMKMNEQLYTYNPMLGFVPVPEKVEEAEETPAKEETEIADRKKRSAQVWMYPGYVPHYVVPRVQYVVPNGAKKVETEEETGEDEPQTLPAVVDTQVPYPGLVQIVRTPVTQIQPLVVVQNPLPFNQYPVIPKEPDSEKPGAFEF